MVNIPPTDNLSPSLYNIDSTEVINYLLLNNKTKTEILNPTLNLPVYNPNIPSQQELQKGGLSVLQMQTKHMEKIEELTRYVIDLYHQNEVLKKENQVIEERLKVLEDLLLKAQKTGDKK